MRIVIAPDKFKHSLTTFEVCNAIAEGLRKASSCFEITLLPLSDGGDGLADAISHYGKFEKKFESVHDPLWRLVKAHYLLSEDGRNAFIEMAQASGLHLLQPAEFNPLLTTSFGTGELIKCAIDEGAAKLIIGGSATNDCGIGMAAALGYRFLDKEGRELEPIGENLLAIHAIDDAGGVDMQHVQVRVASDVTNPLTGDNGATRIYGPQKGATPEMVERLEAGVQHFAQIVKKNFGVDIASRKGSGAAGGMGAGCMFFLNAETMSGAELLMEHSNAEQHIQHADAVITGEGKIDSQTWNGKLVDVVTKLCAKHQKPVIALCGTLEASEACLKANGLTAAFSICQCVRQPRSSGVQRRLLTNSKDLTRPDFLFGAAQLFA
jgi:glycerate 2-kinase